MKTWILAILTLLISACTSVSYTTQNDENSYLQLEGNFQNTNIQLGDENYFVGETTESFELNGQPVVKIEVASGKHELVVSKDDKIVIQKYIFLSEGQTFAVSIP